LSTLAGSEFVRQRGRERAEHQDVLVLERNEPREVLVADLAAGCCAATIPSQSRPSPARWHPEAVADVIRNDLRARRRRGWLTRLRGSCAAPRVPITDTTEPT